jgi:anti-sigma factor RsiW
MQNHLTENDLILHYYGELAGSDERRVADHLSGCKDCQKGFRQLQRVLAAVDERAFAGPESPEHFERTVWARLEPNLRRDRSGWFSWFVLSPGRLAWVSVVLVLVAAAFMAGRLSPRPDTPGAATVADASAAQVRERILLIDVGDHLEQSQMVLIELLSASDQEPLSIADERTRAGELVAANRLYRLAASASGDMRIANLLDDLEPVLIDIAASPENVSSQDLDEIRRRIESKSLLFKVRVVSQDVRQRQRTFVRERAGQRSSL